MENYNCMVLTNLKLLEDESVKEQRKEICGSCEHFKLTICEQCGCLMPLKWQFEHAKCPLNKWPIV